MGLFKSKEEKERLSRIKTLLAVAWADGELSRKECTAIAAVASRENVSIKEVEDMLDGKDKVTFVVPSSEEDKAKHLEDLCVMMMIDGTISEAELDLCRSVAERYGYRPEVIDNLAMAILENIRRES